MNQAHVRSLRLALLVSAALALVARADASVSNGDFSAGLAGWTTLGDVGVTAGPAAFLTTASLDQDDAPAAAGAFNFSGTSADLAGVANGLEEFAGLAIGGLDPDFAGGILAFEGSALKQSFAVNAGDTLSFTYDFRTNDNVSADFAFLVVEGMMISLADFSDASASLGAYSFATGASPFQYTFTQTGSVTVVFGVVDAGDFAATSALAVSDVAVSAIPEPSAFAALAGVAGLALAGLRRRRAVRA